MNSKLIIPEAVLSQNIIALGKPGSGKSSKLRILVEHLLKQKRPVCILDPKGDWWGLKLAADGKGAGYPVLIFGGEHGDIPITEHAGASVAEIVAAGNNSCIIDLGGWMPGARSRFFTDFASSLFRLPHPAMHLVLDECHNFAPQGKVLDPMAGKSLHWANRIASEGRSKGITVIGASQRPQKVHKDFITTCETLIACRLIHSLDRDAVGDWIKGCADPVLGKQVIGELAQMSRMQAWVWSPETNFGPEKITFPLFSTFDSFSPQANLVQHQLPPALGLDEIRMKLAAVVKEAESSDPKLLKAKIADLEKINGQHQREIKTLTERLAAATAVNPNLPKSTQSGPDVNRLQGVLMEVWRSAETLSKGIQRIGAIAVAAVPSDQRHSGDGVATRKRMNREAAAETIIPVASSTITYIKPNGKPEARVINALAWWEKVTHGPYSKVQLAAACGYSPSSGGFGNILGKLKGSGLINYPQPGMVEFTVNGRATAAPVEAPANAAELHRMIYGKLTAPQQKVLRVVIEQRKIRKEQLAHETGYSPTSGGFGNLVGQLRSLGMLDYPTTGVVEAAAFLYAVKD